MFPTVLRPAAIRRQAPAWLSHAPQSVAGATRPAMLRAVLLAGCVIAVAFAAWAGDPTASLQADPALARLLRCMALIKGLLVLGALGAVLWRFGWPVGRPVAAAYAGGTWVLAGSTTLIWQLSHIPLAAVLFHAAAIGMLAVGWRERG
jgi:hypothetical protein